MMKMFRIILSTFAAILAAATMVTLPARAEVTIDITKGTVEPLPIAITDFLSGDQLGRQYLQCDCGRS